MMTTAAEQRKNMVESQVRPSNVTDRRITAAMSTIEREKYLPDDARVWAYMDTPITISDARSMTAPRDLARLIQLAEVEAGESVLIVGALMGYSAKIFAEMGASVTALETETMATPVSDGAITQVTGPLEAGWSAGAPYDVVFVEGWIAAEPAELLKQLRPGAGRLVTVLSDKGVPFATRLTTTNGAVSRRQAFECWAPALPGFKCTESVFEF